MRLRILHTLPGPRRAVAAAGTLHTSAAAGLERAAGRAGVVLDRVDDVLVPPIARVLDDGLDRAESASRVFAARIGNRFGASVPTVGHAGEEEEDDGHPGARDGQAAAAGPLLAASRYGGHLARGARLGVSVAVAAIVVSAVTATLQGPDRLGFPPGPVPRDGAGPDSGRVAGVGDGTALEVHVPEPKASEATAPDVKITVGPYPSDEVGAYLTYARSRLSGLEVAAPDAELFAVVSFTGYRTPAELLGLLSGYRMHRVFIRLPPDGEVFEAQVRDPVADVDAAFVRAADVAARRMVSTADPEAYAQAGQEASAYGSRCPCVFSAVVRAPAGRLAQLAGAGGVRVVDVASPGATMAGAVFVPLLPERR